MKLFDQSQKLLERAMDVRLARQNALASNAANIDTPDHTPLDVDFEAAMAETAEKLAGSERAAPARTLSMTNDGHFSISAPRIDAPESAGEIRPVAIEGTEAGQDGNAVDLDQTMTAIAENALHYGAATRTVGKKLALLRYVASDGNG